VRRLYGAGPGHLLALLGCFVVSGYAATRLLDELPILVRIAVWFLGAALAWDLLLGPALALVDRVLRAGLGSGRVPLLNYVRVPALMSGTLLLVFAPLVLRRSTETFERKSGLDGDVYLGRWLAVTAVLFAASALLWLVARSRAVRAG
jgi:hypothetical protein